MSYDIDIFVRRSNLPGEWYTSLVRRCAQIHGIWRVRETKPLQTDGPDPDEVRHQFCVEDETNPLAKGNDVESWVCVWLNLWRNRPDECPPVTRGYEWRLSVETGSGRSLLDMVIQLSVPLLEFDVLADVTVEDIQCGLQGEPEYFQTSSAWRAHAARVLRSMHDPRTLEQNDFIGRDGLKLRLVQGP